jgi:guanylate kinase
MTRGAPEIIVVSGPSGVGKSTVVDLVLEKAPRLVRSISLTTRPARGRERDGVEYRFVSPEEFAGRRDRGELLEWAEVHGNLYGTSAEFVEKELAEGNSVLLEIDVQGGMLVKEKRPGAVTIFISPPSWEVLERRLRGRGTDREVIIAKRLENAKKEMEFAHLYAYKVVNDDLRRCVSEVARIIETERGG